MLLVATRYGAHGFKCLIKVLVQPLFCCLLILTRNSIFKKCMASLWAEYCWVSIMTSHVIMFYLPWVGFVVFSGHLSWLLKVWMAMIKNERTLILVDLLFKLAVHCHQKLYKIRGRIYCIQLTIVTFHRQWLQQSWNHLLRFWLS